MEKLYVSTRIRRASRQHCKSPRLPPVPQYFWGHNRIPSRYLASSFRPGHLVIDLVPQIEADKQRVKQEHNQQLEALEQKLDQAVLTQTGSLAGLEPLLAIERKLAAVNHLTAKYQAELQTTRQAANQFLDQTRNTAPSRNSSTAAGVPVAQQTHAKPGWPPTAPLSPRRFYSGRSTNWAVIAAGSTANGRTPATGRCRPVKQANV